MVAEVISKEAFLSEKSKYFSAVRNGAVFIYPTDTIYGVGCDASNDAAVRRIRELKKRDAKPFSVIAPSKEWILKNCEVPRPELLDKLPGPYTIIFPRFKKGAVSEQVCSGTLGVRIPNHWMSAVAHELGIPIVTTSVNVTGEPHSADIDSLRRFAVDFIVYEGVKKGSPSTIVDGVSGFERKR